MVTPLQPKEFFRGIWTGEGDLIPHLLLRWFLPREHLRHRSEPIWLSETMWLVRERFEFSSGRVVERKMFCELIAPDRIHVTADDMPLGADIQLYGNGFYFSPYYALVSHKGGNYRLRCLDECRIDENGFLYNRIKMYFWGLLVVTLHLGPINRNAPQGS